MVNAKVNHDCKDELHEVELRATPARVALMSLFETADKPLDVQSMIEYLQKQNIKTDPATVFRIVNMFTEKGLTRQIQLQESKARYELATNTDHHHLVCTKCGDIQDIANCNFANLEADIYKKTGFKAVNHSLEFFGICKLCQH